MEEFNENSTGHILAVSGLHIGFLFALLSFLSRKSKNKFVVFVVIAVIILYGEMTLWSPSTIRATLVLSIHLLAIIFKKKPDLLTSISASAMLILFFNPYMLFNSGFQMSFMALLGLTFFIEPLNHFVGKVASPILSIQFGVAPLIAYTFNRFNILSMFINIPIVFLTSILVPMSIMCLMTQVVLGFSPKIFINAIEVLSKLVLSINHYLNFEGIFSIKIQGLNTGILLLFYIALFIISSEWARVQFIRNKKGQVFRAISLCLIPVIIIGVATYNKYLNDEIVFVSVGQGDCTHIRYKSNNVLIDGGGNTEYNIGKNTLMPYLLKNRVRSIDLALLTHLHTDHFKGILELNSVYPVDVIGIPYICKFDDESVALERLKNISTINLDTCINLGENILIKPLWPVQKYANETSADDANENNMVYIIIYNGIKILVTGDLIEEDERKMLEYYKNSDELDCDILKIGHHGSKTSSSEEFLDATSPEIAVICVGLNNMYGHPNQETLDKLTERGIKTYRTDLNGAVGIDIHKSRVLVDTMR